MHGHNTQCSNTIALMKALSTCGRAKATLQLALQEGRAKRKVGRPIAYRGDPYAPGLAPEQRRVILRRIANRESARRVRARRQDELDRLTQQVRAAVPLLHESRLMMI